MEEPRHEIPERGCHAHRQKAWRCSAAAPRYDLDAGRAGVDGVFDKFLDDAGGALDDFTRRDLVDDGFA